MKNTPSGRLWGWRSRRRWHRGTTVTPDSGATRSRQAAAGQTGAGTGARESAAGDPAIGEAEVRETVAAAMQLAIGLLTAGLDSPELEAWAAVSLTPHDADGLGNFMAGLHVVSELLLSELHEATGEPPERILQRLALLAEHRRGTPFSS